MRKIELEMREAIRNNAREWRNSNTRIERLDDCRAETHYPMSHAIYLHDNLIAHAWADASGHIEADPVIETLREWPTVTTLSRLRALNVNVSRANNWVHLNSDLVCEAR